MHDKKSDTLEYGIDSQHGLRVDLDMLDAFAHTRWQACNPKREIRHTSIYSMHNNLHTHFLGCTVHPTIIQGQLQEISEKGQKLIDLTGFYLGTCHTLPNYKPKLEAAF